MPIHRSSLLWSIDHDGTRSYIFGSMHVRDYRVHSFVEGLKPFVLSCDSFCAEFNLDAMAFQQSNEFQYLKNGKTLADYYSEKQYQKMVRSIKKSYKLDLTALYRLLPLFIINAISETVFVNSANMSMDAFLWQLAKQESKTTFGLETLEEQFKILDSIPLSTQLKSLKDLASHTKQYRRKLLKMVSVYEKQDIDLLYQITKRTLGKQRKVLLYNRNRQMVDRLSNRLTIGGSIFAVVGAAHLAGNMGVLALLKRNGFRLKPVSLSSALA